MLTKRARPDNEQLQQAHVVTGQRTVNKLDEGTASQVIEQAAATSKSGDTQSSFSNFTVSKQPLTTEALGSCDGFDGLDSSGRPLMKEIGQAASLCGMPLESPTLCDPAPQVKPHMESPDVIGCKSGILDQSCATKVNVLDL